MYSHVVIYSFIFSYHPQQQQGQLPHMMPQPQQVHHLMQQSSSVSAQNRDHHQHSHPPKEMTKPKGRMSAYTFFVQKCRDEHRKAYPNENANFSEFSKKCAEKWKVRINRRNLNSSFVLMKCFSLRNLREVNRITNQRIYKLNLSN